MSETRTDHLIWERILIPDAGALSPAITAYIQGLGFTAADQDAMNELSAKARAGTLTPDETLLLDEYIQIGLQLTRIRSLVQVVSEPHVVSSSPS